MARPHLTTVPRRIQTDHCPLCLSSVNHLTNHIKEKHTTVIQKSDIFWIGGVNQAMYAGRIYGANAK